MGLNPFSALLDIADTALDKIFPDANQKMMKEARLESLRQITDWETLSAQVQIILAQIDVNAIQGKHKSLF